jgi:hypothetical protein
VWRRARQQPGLLFTLNCSAVIDFSALALTALGRLRKHLREFGCELALVKCSPSVLERRDDPLLSALLTAQPPEPETAPSSVEAPAQPAGRVNRLTAAARADGPHAGPQMPHYLRGLVRDSQRYWLN